MHLLTGSHPLKLSLAPQDTVSLRDGDGAFTVKCESGRIWLTADGDGRDVVLTVGESVSFPAGRHVVAQALGAAELRVCNDRRAAA